MQSARGRLRCCQCHCWVRDCSGRCSGQKCLGLTGTPHLGTAGKEGFGATSVEFWALNSMFVCSDRCFHFSNFEKINWEPHLAMSRGSSCICPQESLAVVFRGSMGCRGWNPGSAAVGWLRPLTEMFTFLVAVPRADGGLLGMGQEAALVHWLGCWGRQSGEGS